MAPYILYEYPLLPGVLSCMSFPSSSSLAPYILYEYPLLPEQTYPWGQQYSPVQQTACSKRDQLIPTTSPSRLCAPFEPEGGGWEEGGGGFNTLA
jgi:hypothetical protein